MGNSEEDANTESTAYDFYQKFSARLRETSLPANILEGDNNSRQSVENMLMSRLWKKIIS